ncbi:MAG: phosphotransferase [Pseudomonadales bacterium]|nr:phosphotransferase [Pseudomonadales bacterium]
MQKNLKQLIKLNYGFSVSSITDAPRQFVAETYFIETDRGKFFCKVIDKQLFIPGVIRSLPILKKLHTLGQNRINYPLTTLHNNLFVMDNGSLLVLFNYIEAPQSYDYDNFLFGKLLGEIHLLSEQLNLDTPKETFHFKHADIFENRLSDLVELESPNITEQAASTLLRKSQDTLLQFYKIFQNLSSTCQKKNWQMLLTHGDAPGNILVKSPTDFYIVDWDDILFAPAERDLWFLLDKKDFMQGYQSVRKDYKVNELSAQYYLFSRYFNDLIEYWAEIFGEFSESHKKSNFEQMKKELFEDEGWLYPLIKQFI